MKSNISKRHSQFSSRKTALFTTVVVIAMTYLSGCQKAVLNALSPADPSLQQASASEFDYSGYFSYKDSTAAGYVGQVYTDSAWFDLKISLKPDPGDPFSTIATASIYNIRNAGPTVIPLSETYQEPGGSTLTWTWVPDTVGLYNIDSVTIENPLIERDSLVDLSFLNDFGITPGYFGLEVPEDGGVPVLVPSSILPPGQVISPVRQFKISRQVQSLGDSTKGFYFKMIPKTE